MTASVSAAATPCDAPGLAAHELSVVTRGGRPLLSDVSLRIAPGDLLGIVGASGSGKTTLARALCGRIAPVSGSVVVDGRPVSSQPGHIDPSIALVSQSSREAFSPRWTVRRSVEEPARLAGVTTAGRQRLVDEACRAAGLDEELFDRLPSAVSEGQLQRASIARALVQQPRYLLCDEVTSALDPITAAGIVHALQAAAASGVGVGIISHDHRLLDAVARRRISLDGGRLVDTDESV